ncbi:hypothetical protein LOAG_00731 [Loa loa]|uniref:Fe2OG dioxygenase domain-containing protein n=1 Tax=Loa loa TaxID=7209 RepID=A0A1S0UCN0_LOALO|nr:hypothetical protein LOAG_00731 [Loa loa]EFO27748.1 hypothetical protein LOAG_00731 [Loa loa]
MGGVETFCCCNQETNLEKRDAKHRCNNVTCMWSSSSSNRFVVKKAPPTIRYIPNFITEEEEKFLLSKVYSVPKPKWQQLLNRRLQNWGGIVSKEVLIPDGAIPSVHFSAFIGIVGVLDCGLKKNSLHMWWIVSGHSPILTVPKIPWLNSVIDKLMTLGDTFPPNRRPNHVLINEYLPGQGIMAHTDGPAFYPMVTTISLGSDTIIDYYKPIDPERNNVKQKRYVGSVLLERRSLILVSDDAYTKYLHEIADRTFDVITSDIFNLESTNKRIGKVVTRDLRLGVCFPEKQKTSGGEKMSGHFENSVGVARLMVLVMVNGSIAP